MLSNNINHFDRAFQESQREELRRGGRFPTTSVQSTLGEVLDISSGGALILKRRFRGVPKIDHFAIEIRFEEIKVIVQVRVVRQSKKKGTGHLIAIEFLEVNEKKYDVIREIVRNSRCWRSIDMTGMDIA